MKAFLSHPVSVLLALSWFFATAEGSSETIPFRTAEGFRVPQPGERLEFPRAHASHPDYKIEWWYLTGHLEGTAGEQYGFQATFFRSGLTPPPAEDADLPETPAFGRDTLFLGHMAVSDLGAARFYHEERFARAGWDADARTDRLDVRLHNWSLVMPDPASDAMDLAFSIEGEVEAALHLQPEKPLVRFGADGTSRKGADPAARSFYLTFPRLAVSGELRVGEATVPVTGSAWMDHEIASQQLGEDLSGWDWTAIQLDDGWEVKAYILRRDDGSADPFSQAMWIAPDGTVSTYYGPDDFDWERSRWWQSPATGYRYPVEVTLTLPDPRPGNEAGATTKLRLVPAFDAQELTSASAGFPYWEGAGRVLDANDKPVGRSYLELVGYAGGAARGLR